MLNPPLDVLSNALRMLRLITRMGQDQRFNDRQARRHMTEMAAEAANDIDLFQRQMREGANDNAETTSPE